MTTDDEMDEERLAESLFGEWVDACPPAQPPSELRARVLARIREGGARNGLRTVPTEVGWVQVAPGIRIKMLYRDEDAQANSCLVRLDPGAVLPPHEHGHVEECLVLEGEVTMGDLTVRAGDYHLAEQGARHAPAYTRTGALLFFRMGINEFFSQTPPS